MLWTNSVISMIQSLMSEDGPYQVIPVGSKTRICHLREVILGRGSDGECCRRGDGLGHESRGRDTSGDIWYQR